MTYTDALTKKERHTWEQRLLVEASRLLEMTREIIPKEGHLSITAFPENNHISVDIYSGQHTEDGKESIMTLMVWGYANGDRLEVHRIE